jgi:predicted DNA-binding transcriptional regulator AlpA
MNRLTHVLRAGALEAATGLKRTQVEEMIAEDSFPPPAHARDDGRAKIWFEHEVAAWQAWRKARRDGVAAAGSSWRDYLDNDHHDESTDDARVPFPTSAVAALETALRLIEQRRFDNEDASSLADLMGRVEQCLLDLNALAMPKGPAPGIRAERDAQPIAEYDAKLA